MVFPDAFGKEAEGSVEMDGGFAVQLILPVLVIDDPGFGFYARQQAESVVLVEDAKVGSRCHIVAPTQVVVNFQVAGGQGEGLGAGEDLPAAAGTALHIRCENPLGACIGAAAAEADLP
jgi:hypothetical protein